MRTSPPPLTRQVQSDTPAIVHGAHDTPSRRIRSACITTTTSRHQRIGGRQRYSTTVHQQVLASQCVTRATHQHDLRQAHGTPTRAWLRSHAHQPIARTSLARPRHRSTGTPPKHDMASCRPQVCIRSSSVSRHQHESEQVMARSSHVVTCQLPRRDHLRLTVQRPP